MENQTVNDGKTIAIISYITFIGTIIAYFMNQSKRNPFAAFHIRQAIGLILLSFAVSFVGRFIDYGWVSQLLSLGLFVLWIIGLLGAVQGQEKKIPLLGDQFQEWFKNFG